MKTPTLILLLMFSLATTMRAADDLTAALQQALFNEEADHDLAAAIKAYQFVVAGADAQRKLAATAVFRLGECYRKLGQTNDAVAQYERIVRDFADQTNLVTLSRQNLAGLSVTAERPRGKGMLGLNFNELMQLQAAQNQAGGRQEPTPGQIEAHRLLIERLELDIKATEANLTRQKELIRQNFASQSSDQEIEVHLLDLRRQLVLAQDAGPTGTAISADTPSAWSQNFSPAARTQLKELLQNEIKITEQFAAEQRKRVENGTIASGDQVRFERDVLGLKRQLVVVDGLTSAEDRQQWRGLLLQEIKLAEEAAKLERQKFEAGNSLASEIARLQRDVLVLKRELVTFDATPTATTSTAGAIEPAATDEEDNEVRRIRALIKDSPDLVNAKRVEVGKYGDGARYGTPLHKAAQQGQLVVARFLIDNHADLDARDMLGWTPLHWAAFNGHKSMVELLPSKGADVNAPIQSDRYVPMAGNTALHLAADAGYRNVCDALLTGKANPNARGLNGETAMNLAARKNFRSIVELLLAKGADINARDDAGGTSLHAAVGSAAKATAELLLAKKADVNAQAVRGDTPLFSAANGKNADLVRMLLASKANPNLACNEKAGTSAGWTPLSAAVSQDDLATARLLLDNGADANALSGRSGWTVLMQAAVKGSLELAEALVAAGADVNARNGGDPRATALYFVTKQNPTNAAAIVELLLKNKADVNVADADGITPLINAVSTRNADVVKLLVENGADVNAMTKRGNSPLSLIKPGRQSGMAVGGLSGLPPSIPYRPVVPGQPDNSPPDPTPGIIALLEQRGARDDLQRLTAISTSRNQENRNGWFKKGTNDWNHYTLLELIAWINPQRGQNQQYSFPDLARVAIGRIDSKTTKTEDFRVNLTTTLTNSDCARNLPLQWGDVVDIPEQDHFIDTSWDRFPDSYYQTFQKCLERTINVTIKGQTNTIVLTPFRLKANTVQTPGGPNPWEPRMDNFRLNRFLRGSGLLLTSSDVTRVKVKRTDPTTKEIRERVFNLDHINQRNDDTNDLWLQDGDVVEVPEKDLNVAPASAAVPDGSPSWSSPARNIRNIPPEPK